MVPQVVGGGVGVELLVRGGEAACRTDAASDSDACRRSRGSSPRRVHRVRALVLRRDAAEVL